MTDAAQTDTGSETGIVSLYVTFPAGFDVEGLLAELVTEKLIACGNILPGIRSVYEWEGKVAHDPETAVILKTRKEAVDALTARIVQAHPYDVPCIVVWPVTGGFAPYLDWVRSQTN